MYSEQILAHSCMYVADYVRGVYQSTDDGVTWSLVLKLLQLADDWRCMHAVEVSSDGNTDVYWTVEVLDSNKGEYRLRVCTVDKRQTGNHVTWRDVTLLSDVTLDWVNNLAYDGHTNVFIRDFVNKAVHVWSVSGQYERQLVSQLANQPVHVAFDSQRGHVMYVGQGSGKISVFKLTYESM